MFVPPRVYLFIAQSYAHSQTDLTHSARKKRKTSSPDYRSRADPPSVVVASPLAAILLTKSAVARFFDFQRLFLAARSEIRDTLSLSLCSTSKGFRSQEAAISFHSFTNELGLNPSGILDPVRRLSSRSFDRHN